LRHGAWVKGFTARVTTLAQKGRHPQAIGRETRPLKATHTSIDKKTATTAQRAEFASASGHSGASAEGVRWRRARRTYERLPNKPIDSSRGCVPRVL